MPILSLFSIKLSGQTLVNRFTRPSTRFSHDLPSHIHIQKMHFSLVAAISLLASAEAAHLWSKPAAKIVKTKEAVAASNYTWTVTGWSAGCARFGCYYGMTLWPPRPQLLASESMVSDFGF